MDTIAMKTRRSKPLTEDSLGLRPGHPIAGEETISCADAAQELNTTHQTVRTLIERGDLAGYWQRAGRIYRFRAYRYGMGQFLASFGQFPDARRHLSRRAQGPTVKNRQGEQRSAPDTSKLELRILGLQETVRCQSAVIANLQQAMSQQDVAADFLRQAQSASSRAAAFIREANDEYSRLVALEGVPDDASGMSAT